mmetsp:Transcript_10856/g.11658  ORF Transcript_10856/g.11658 Transcript_10856/m.11658 type:complete len:601 (-) Transcript_10856:505-2307(-)
MRLRLLIFLLCFPHKFAPSLRIVSTMKDVKDINNVCTKSFANYASLNEEGFYAAIVAEGYSDLTGSPYAAFLYRNSSRRSGTDGVCKGVSLEVFKETLATASWVRKKWELDVTFANEKDKDDNNNKRGISELDFPEVGVRWVVEMIKENSEHIINDELLSPDSLRKFHAILGQGESFSKYDEDKSGIIQEGEMLVWMLLTRAIYDAYIHVVTGTGNHNTAIYRLTKETYHLALERLIPSLPDVSKFSRGQFYDSVFERADSEGNEYISFVEFTLSASSFINSNFDFSGFCNFPGWKELIGVRSVEDVTTLTERLLSLRTGDIIVFQGGNDNAMGRFMNFGLKSPWCHSAVVVKRSPLTGTANKKTEELLRKYPFRRRSHRFCSPGYCRCYDSTKRDFEPSRFSCLAEIGLLESTGEGTHLYDLANRLFEQADRKYLTIGISRLNDAPDRDNTAKINEFIMSVRGELYSVTDNELNAAMTYHVSSSSESIPRTDVLPKKNENSSEYCASLVMKFYEFMGWVDGDLRPANSVMPCDFVVQVPCNNNRRGSMRASGACQTNPRPIQLKKGQGYISPLEIITCPDLDAELPLKLPKKKVKSLPS